MIVLRLTNSDDLNESVPAAERVGAIAGNRMSEEIGEPVETVTRVIWATYDLPDRIDKWLDQYKPEFVFMKVNWYWYGYESVPLRIERLLGPRFGKPLARLGVRAAESPTVGTKRPFMIARRYAHRVIGGDSPFTTEHVIAVMEATIRRIIAHEQVVLLVKGTGRRDGHDDPGTWYYAPALRKKIAYVEDALREKCAAMHVAWTDIAAQGRLNPADKDMARGDGIHVGRIGQRAMGEKEGLSMAEAWRAVRTED